MAIIFHTINGIGLGHLTRQLEIALNLRMVNPQVAIYFLTSAEWHPLLIEKNIPFYHVPSAPEFRITGSLQAWEDMTKKELCRCSPPGLAESILRVVVKYHAPSAIIFDSFFPLKETIDFLAKGIPCFCVVDAYSRLKSKSFDTFLQEGGVVFVCSDSTKKQNVYDKQIIHVGRILQKEGKSDLDQSNVQNSIFRILCAQGGGGFRKGNSVFYMDHPEFSEVIGEAFKNLQNTFERQVEIEYILGPYGSIRDAERLPNWIKITKTVSNIPKLLQNCDLFITRGGYSAVSDSIAGTCPGIFLPIKEPVENQNEHMEFILDKGMGFVANHDSREIINLVKNILENLEKLQQIREVLKRKKKESNGASYTAELLNKMLPKEIMNTCFSDCYFFKK